VQLFLLGRALMKLGEDALPEPPGGSGRYAGSTRTVLIVATDIAEHPDSAVGEIAARTGLPQSQVSSAISRLKEAGTVVTTTDPTDRRRALVTQAPTASDRLTEVRATTIIPALTEALGTDDPTQLTKVTAALDQLAEALLPAR
jgi:DNA-binding MarR family transcriptional regulator